ncbi:MAG: GNAT family N-acetyltransferase [Armatimonas sp.]
MIEKSVHLRLATREDIPALSALITLSAQELSAGYYSPQQITGAITYVFGVDTQLIDDGTYWVMDEKDQLIGCGGWSFRQTLYGGNQMKSAVDPKLDPTIAPARIRAFFVHPDHARRGIGRQLLERCLTEAQAAGFQTYRAYGYTAGCASL